MKLPELTKQLLKVYMVCATVSQGAERNLAKVVRKPSQGADFYLEIPKVSFVRPWEFPRCLLTDLGNSQGATALLGFVYGLHNESP